MPHVRSKAEQRFIWGVLVPAGKMTATEARKRSVKGKTFKKLPARKHRKGKR